MLNFDLRIAHYSSEFRRYLLRRSGLRILTRLSRLIIGSLGCYGKSHEKTSEMEGFSALSPACMRQCKSRGQWTTACRLPAWSPQCWCFSARPPRRRLYGRAGEAAQGAKCGNSGDAGPSCTSAAAVVRAAYQLCGGAPVDEALLAIGMQPGQAADAAGRALVGLGLQDGLGLGLQTALDLRLVLGDGPDAHELMSDLQAAGLSLGDRSKIRLLVGGDQTAEQTG